MWALVSFIALWPDKVSSSECQCCSVVCNSGSKCEWLALRARKWLITGSGMPVYSAITLAINGFYVPSQATATGSVYSGNCGLVLPSGEWWWW